MYRSDDGGASWRSIENGLPSSFGFPVAAHPRDADTLFFLPLNGDTKGRYPPDARAAVWRSRDGGAHWTDGRAGLPQSGAYFGVMRQALATEARSRRRLFRHEQRLRLCKPRRGRDMGVHCARPAGDLVGRNDDGGLMVAPAVVRLPALLKALFPEAERVVKIEAETIEDVMNGLEARWPGMRDRLCDTTPAIRRHINVFVQGKRARLDTRLEPDADVYILTAVSGG
jgi:molybdopterin converting factor small subunit